MAHMRRMSSLGVGALLLVACGAAEEAGGVVDDGAAEDSAAASCARGTLAAGQSYTLNVDGHSGDEGTTTPKADLNDGKNGDNPYFQRHNVARAHLDYWFTSKHREAGEPDPRGEQWVDYRPPLRRLGAGRYRVTAQYRQTENRASYEAQYRVTHAGGEAVVKRSQRQGSGVVSVVLGDYDLGCSGWVRVQDTGPDSITFNKMTFTFLGR